MTIGVLALVGVTPDRVAALTAAGYAVHEGKKYATRTDAIRAAAATVRAVLTNGCGGLSDAEMACCPSSRSSTPWARAMKRSIWPPPDAGASWSPIAPTRTPLRSPTPRCCCCWPSRGTCWRPIASSVPGAGRSNGGSRPRPLQASAWVFLVSEKSGAGLRSARRTASLWRSAITPGRRSPAAPIAISPVSLSSRRGPIAWSPPHRGARGRGTSSTRPCSQRSARTAISSTSGAGRSWIPRPCSTRCARSAWRGQAWMDVLEGEPGVPPLLPELLQCDNVVVTPHVAGRAPESRTAATAMILANLNAHFAGQPLPSPVARTA